MYAVFQSLHDIHMQLTLQRMGTIKNSIPVQEQNV